MPKIDVAGLKIDSITKLQLLTEIERRVLKGQKTWITTPYSEFLYRALRRPYLLEMLNKSDFAVPDGIGIFWAAKFLQIPLTAKSYTGKILQTFWQALCTLFLLLTGSGKKGEGMPVEKITGSDLIWDIAELAAKNNLSIFLLGGFGNTAQITSKKLSSKIARTLFDDRQKVSSLKVAGWSNKNPGDESIIEDIKKLKPDILLVAYGPIRQEQWITDYMNELPAKLYVGLGGTFDYIAGTKTPPPKFIRAIGLEWLWRLFTQPYRIKRIWQATAGLIVGLIRYKIFTSYPYRKNVVSVILNRENKVLVCERNPEDLADKIFGYRKPYTINYWQFPQGGMDKGESVEQTAIRECREELGITDLELLKISSATHSYLWPNSKRPLLHKQVLLKGQEQRIAYLRFTGQDSEIKLDMKELINFKWVPLSDIHKTVHQERAPVAKIVQEDLKDLA